MRGKILPDVLSANTDRSLTVFFPFPEKDLEMELIPDQQLNGENKRLIVHWIETEKNQLHSLTIRNVFRAPVSSLISSEYKPAGISLKSTCLKTGSNGSAFFRPFKSMMRTSSTGPESE
jgi:hypothetical protein